jgi:hypothetical protein
MRMRRAARFGGIAAVIMAVTWWMLPAWGQSARTPTGTAGMSQAGRTTLAGELAAARTATAKYATNLSRAKADGYQIITMMMPNMGFHFLNPGIQGFNVRKPQILVYEHTGHKWQLGALEWIFTKMPKNPPLPNATFGSFPAACHYKDGTFVPDENASTCPKTAPHTGAKFNFLASRPDHDACMDLVPEHGWPVLEHESADRPVQPRLSTR